MHRIGRRHQLVVGRTDDGCIGFIRTDRGNSEHAWGCGKNREVKVVAHPARSIEAKSSIAIKVWQLGIDLRWGDKQHRNAQSVDLQTAVGQRGGEVSTNRTLANRTQVAAENRNEPSGGDRLREIGCIDYPIYLRGRNGGIVIPRQYRETGGCESDNGIPACKNG